MRAIIVDDEPRAIELLKSYVGHFSSIELVGTFRNGMKALEFLASEKIDLIFLDINMPHISGISVSKLVKPSTKIIFTTAYSEYAVESYEVNAVDYLLKPIGLDRFTKAISKVLSQAETNSPSSLQRDSLWLKSGSKTVRIRPADVLYIEKDGNYSTYHLPHQKIITRESVATVLANLPDHFLQVQKSYVVNIHAVSSIDKDLLYVNDIPIPIGASFKERTKALILKS